MEANTLAKSLGYQRLQEVPLTGLLAWFYYLDKGTKRSDAISHAPALTRPHERRYIVDIRKKRGASLTRPQSELAKLIPRDYLNE